MIIMSIKTCHQYPSIPAMFGLPQVFVNCKFVAAIICGDQLFWKTDGILYAGINGKIIYIIYKVQ